MAKRKSKWEDMFTISAKERLIQRLRYDDPKEVWNEFATLYAKDRHENDFATRRGYFTVSDVPTASGHAFCIFDNRPYRKEGTGNAIDHRRREKLMELFREKLKHGAIFELGCGAYPTPGEEQAGYSSAIMLDADDSKTEMIIDAFHESVRETDEWHANESHEKEIEHAHEARDVARSPNAVRALPDLVNVGVASQVRQVRVGQDAFSRAVRENYGHRCCFPGCAVDHDDLLVAAHIDRWADNPEARGDVANGLCLCGLHDKAFESGFFTLTDDLFVKVDVRKGKLSTWVVSQLQKADGLPIEIGRIRPCSAALAKHRERHA
jgi:hypothetical protein